VGWCSANAKGSLDCSGGELALWSGVCRGAQIPALVDSCGPGDFNCDGLMGNNSQQGCNCATSVVCPTNAITTAPYPSATAIPIVDGSQWITDATQRAQTTNWTWTVLGGDCDNVLPFPTFALYNQANSTVANARKGSRATVALDMTANPPKYIAAANQPLVAIQATNYGSGVAGGQVFPAFGLSGDYIVQGEFTLNGQQYHCSQKVQVRAPGIRAELCWDTVGSSDIDLHLARLQGLPASCGNKGWDTTCSHEDCYYASGSGCTSGSAAGPGWGYPDSANSACLGWSSKRDPNGTQKCTNPRLDADNVSCDRTQADPTNTGGIFGLGFCGPENINLDNPKDNDTFAVGVNDYGSSASTKTHVNLYCNGERVISVGYNPATGSAFPVLNTAGGDTTGDFWTVATIKAHVTNNQLTGCDVSTVPSRHADPVRDGMAGANGGAPICVDHGYASKNFVDNGTGQVVPSGTIPTTPAQWCKH
jgi:hypothetical protein